MISFRSEIFPSLPAGVKFAGIEFSFIALFQCVPSDRAVDSATTIIYFTSDRQRVNVPPRVSEHTASLDYSLFYQKLER